MMHKIKRSVVGGMQSRHIPKDAQFKSQRERLVETDRGLKYALNSIKAAKRMSVSVAEHTKDFCGKMCSIYPEEDAMQMLLKKTFNDTKSLEREVKVNPNAWSSVSVIERHLRAYLGEIKSLKRKYRKVENARRDYAMYQKKLGKVERKHAAENKTARYLELFEDARANYDSILDGILHQLRSTLEKSPDMFQSAYVAYWLAQGKMHSAMAQYCKPAIEYAVVNETKIVRSTSTPTTMKL